MTNRKSLASLAVVMSVILSACATAAPTPAPAPAEQKPTDAPKATEAPAATEAPKPTEAPKADAAKPTEAPKADAGAMSADSLMAPDCNYGGEIKSIEAVDKLTVKFSLCASDPAFPQKVTGSSFGIMDKDNIAETKGDAKTISEKPVGTGPYILKEWKRGDSVTLEANPNYWQGQSKNKQLVIRWSKEAAQSLLELQSGNVDGIEKVATEDFDTVGKDSKLKLVPIPPLNSLYVGMNVNKAPFDNEKVRQAFAMAVDRKKIVDEYYPAGSQVAQNWAPDSFVPGFSPSVQWYEHDPEGAKKLLTEAGFDFNQEIPLSYREAVRVYLPAPGKVAQEVQAQLAEIGVKIRLEPKESGTFLKSASGGNETFMLLGWGADYPDATNFYDTHFGAAVKTFGKPFDDIIEQLKIGATNSDKDKRQAAYDKLNALIKQHAPMIPVAHGVAAQAFLAEVEGAHANPLTPNEYWRMKGPKDTFVYMQSAEPITLDCADETDGETFNVCGQIFETLLSFKPGTIELVPALAESFTANENATEFTFKLRSGVKFSNGAELAADDVVATFARGMDATNPAHKGDDGSFQYFKDYFGPTLINEKK